MQVPRTPLRRVSQNSLFGKSTVDPDSQVSGLAFLDAAFSELADETDHMHSVTEGMRQLSESLAKFNESFASWLYVMDMNSLTIDWPQAPSEASFMLAKRRAERDAKAAMEAIEQANRAAAIEAERREAAAREASAREAEAFEQTYTDTTFAVGNTTSALLSRPGVKKKAGKPKLTAKEKKERSIEVEKVIACLPLEFRGSDPNLRRNMESVIEGLLDASNRVVKLTDLISPPDLNQARVNKCLIALGTVLYHWQGI
ncbi:unnamed protein product [Mycena citricolor]|uniref:DASH complex subunit DAM1 n=1 Tax=Mycena citricolor TaxID=2018698 RepID=A0AAD2Q2Y8_9AGAR|nr:unnamed protein product [Mycena citricolor]